MQLHTQILDATVLAVTTLATAASTIILGQVSPEAQSAELRLLLLPFIGSLCMSGAAIMLNPATETRRIVIGRALIALFLGTLTPQLVSVIHPKIAELSIKPVFLLIVGGLSSGLFYVLSRPFFGELYKRADAIAARGADELERRIPGSDNKP